MQSIASQETERVGGGLEMAYTCPFISAGGALALVGAGNAFSAVGGMIALGAAALACIGSLGTSGGDYTVGDWDYTFGA